MANRFTTKYFGTHIKEIGNADFLISFFVCEDSTRSAFILFGLIAAFLPWLFFG